ncbi:MAG TPA: hypothetical protein VG269_12910 [Tepidisphaeraceae bacterium]|jgi:hypothetical protein|nr:hypothetical protein [Tepidisphaeraceae bacterium]
MRASDLRQWQWILISLVVGAGVGYVFQRAGEDLSGTYGDQLVSQWRFEEALLKVEEGKPCFTDVAVHKQMVPDRKGGTKPAYIVAGVYYNGQVTQENGKIVRRWRPSFFQSDIPYKPATDPGHLGKPDAAAKFEQIAQPTVIDYLNLLGETRGVQYTNAWWRAMGVKSWMFYSFLVIGVAWPILINLMTFGSIRRPGEEKGIDLSKVKAHEEKPAPVVASDADLDQLNALDAELEKNLADAPPAPATVVAAEPAPVRKLAAAPLKPAPAAQSAEQKAFAAKQNDFYPTELRAPRPPEKTQK